MDDSFSKVNEAAGHSSFLRDDGQSENRLYTVEDWLSWDEDVRAELLEGKLIMLAQPTVRHQRILREINGQLWQFLIGKPCEVFMAPFGVRLFENEDTAFEPDIVVICDKEKLDERICRGAPDMVIEILSPSTARMDRGQKYIKYQKAGVREYWIVDPDLNLLQAGVLKDGSYITTVFEANDIAPVTVLEGCEINLADVFSED